MSENNHKPEKYEENAKKAIIQEHFWFTLTTLTVNGFLISSSNINHTLSIIVSSIVSCYAAFLIIDRAAEHANIQNDYMNGHKTYGRMIRFFKHLPGVILDFNGAFFYLLSVLSGYKLNNDNWLQHVPSGFGTVDAESA